MEVGVMSSTSNGLPHNNSNGNGTTVAVTQEKNANNKTTNGATLLTAAEIQKKPQKGKVESIGQEDPWFKQATSKGVKVLHLPLTHLSGSVYMHQICVWQHVRLGKEKA